MARRGPLPTKQERERRSSLSTRPLISSSSRLPSGRESRKTTPAKTVRGRHAGTDSRLILERWGFTPQKPVKTGSEQNPEAVERWLKTEYPKVVAMAKKEKAEIYRGDETGVQNEANKYAAMG